MDDNSTPDVVTEDEAIEKVKRWVEEMDWEKAQEGCKEILEVDPGNEDIKALLAQAEKGLAERPTEAIAPSASIERAPSSEATSEILQEKTEPKEEAEAPAKPQEETPATTPPGASEAKQIPTPTAQPAPTPQRKSKSTVIIAAIVGFIIVALLILALVFGWLNPVFDWVFGLIG